MPFAVKVAFLVLLSASNILHVEVLVNLVKISGILLLFVGGVALAEVIGEGSQSQVRALLSRIRHLVLMLN